MTDIHILVAEDDEHIGGAIRAFLLDAGYQVELFTDGERAHERLYDRAFHLVILDIMLPGMDGMKILAELRKNTGTPVIIITALSGEQTQIRAFDSLADDYLQKPFSMQVLLKRAEALLRRSGALRREIRFGKLSLDRETYRASWNGKAISLTLREFEILSLLASSENRVVPHELPVNIIKTIRGVGYVLDGEAR